VSEEFESILRTSPYFGEQLIATQNMTDPAHRQARNPRAIEVGFPIVEINRLAQPERNSFKPIYQMHKWFARRASCVFRAILLGALKPAQKADGTPTELMEEFYRNHSEDPDTAGKVVLDPFMGGGTTVVEALRLGCRVVGIDLNPVAWLVVKAEVEPVELDALRAAFERLAARPVAWNGGAPLRESLLGLYRTGIAPEVEADVIYTFWVKHAICTDPTCRREVPLFKDYLIAKKSLSVRYHRDVLCPACKKSFDWEIEVASLIADTAMMVNSPRGSAGEGRPHQAWSYAEEPEKPKGRGRWDGTLATVHCPHCDDDVRVQVPWDKKKQRKKVPLTVLLCPACEAVWQWRGALPDDPVNCPACGHSYDPRAGNVPAKGAFKCSCGNRDKIIESIRLLPPDQRLPARPYAIQAYLKPPERPREPEFQNSLFGDAVAEEPVSSPALPEDLLLPQNGKFFKQFSTGDQARLQRADTLWNQNKARLPYPKSAIPVGHNTNQMLKHNYRYWYEMFAPRQLLALATLLDGIMAEEDEKLREMLLCAFSGMLDLNNLFTRYMVSRSSAGGQTAQGVFARHDFQPKITIAENNVFGLPEIAMGSFQSKFRLLIEGISYRSACWDFKDNGDDNKREKVKTDSLTEAEPALLCDNAATARHEPVGLVVTDPPYVGNVNYSELADFYYVWQRLALKEIYPWFAPEFTPKAEEIIENHIRGRSRRDFYAGLSQTLGRIHDQLPIDGLLVFTFHHSDQEGTVWEGLLQSLCDTGFEIAAVYPIHAESESSLHLRDKENVAYDLIHVCRKRQENPSDRSWAGVRQEVRRRARVELAAIEAGRYGNQPLPEPDVRLVCIGKCLELYSAHYNRVLDHEGNPLPLHRALRDIGAIVDQLVTRERPLPPELEDIDALSYAWLRLLMRVRSEVSVDKVNKGLRAMQVSTEDLKKAGLITRGRTGRGRTYEVKATEGSAGGRAEAFTEGLGADRPECPVPGRPGANRGRSAPGRPSARPHRACGCRRIRAAVAGALSGPARGGPRRAALPARGAGRLGGCHRPGARGD
jgi:putative DNA methylase